MNDFKDKTSAELLDIILQGKEQSDEAMYYVLKVRIRAYLKEKFKAFEHTLFEYYDDVVDEIFLYLVQFSASPKVKKLITFVLATRNGGNNR